MNFHNILLILVIVILTLISGIGDAQGFIHATSIWVSGKIIWTEALKSLLGFLTGAIGYIFAINYLKQVGIVTPELQTMIWFTVAIIGVALASGKFLHWHRIDQFVAFIGIMCIGWLVIHHG